MRKLAFWSTVVSVMASTAFGLPNPGSGGKDGGPVSLLFVMSGGGEGGLSLDTNVVARLRDRGYLFQTVTSVEPLTADYLRQFNAVVLVGLDDFAGGDYYAPGGVVLVNLEKNVKLIQQYVEDGGGLLVTAGLGSGSQNAAVYDQALAPWKMRVGWEVIQDDANAMVDTNAPGKKLPYAWTRNLSTSPLTEGVKSLAYPTCVMRWDDMYPNGPLFPDDSAWQVLVRGEKSSKGLRMGNGYKMVEGDAGSAPVMAAARDAGKGRVVVFGLTPYYLLTHAFAEKGKDGKPLVNIGEQTTGPLAGIAYERGDGKTPSQWGLLMDNAFRWLAEASTKAGLGGKPQAWATKLARVERPSDTVPSFAMVDWKTQEPPPTWMSHSPTPTWWRGQSFYDEIPDPLVTTPQKMNRVLVGARSAYSGGKGTVADWAKAAKASGYSVLVFTERFEDFKPENWARFINECNANSDADFACLQGFEIPDSYGNLYLVLGSVNFPSAGMLTADGKALEMTARLSLGFAQHIAVIHRCGKSKLSKELYRHFQGISVYTYADEGGKYQLVDDGFSAYVWHLNNAANPVPIVVHELTNPADIAAKGTIGFQLIVPSQNALEARRYFRHGLPHFFENPHRYFITEGPLIDAFSIFNKDIGDPALNRDHWRAIVGARSGDPTAVISEAVLYDRGEVARRWTPDASAFAQMIDGDHGGQRHFMLIATDSKGRRAISPHLRTVARGYYTRCGDRQNWFGAAGSYTGIWPSGTHGVWYINPGLPGAPEAETFTDATNHPMASKMYLPFASDAMTFTGYTINERYIRPVHYGMDAWAIHNTEPSKTYEAEVMVGKWHDIGSGIGSAVIATLTTVDASMRTKIPVKPSSTVFPVIQACGGNPAYAYVANGQTVTGRITGAEAMDLPAGAIVDDLLLLSPLTVSSKGSMGWRADTNKEVAAGTEWKASYIYCAPSITNRAMLGAAGQTPWALTLTQGKYTPGVGIPTLNAEDGGVVGTLKAGGGWKFLPIQVQGLNANWPAAVWTPKGLAYYMWSGLVKPERMPGTMAGTFLQHMGIHRGVGYAVLDNASDAPFFAGNTLTASNPDLILAYTYWTATEAGIEVNNPTDKAITAKLTSPAAIQGNCKVDTNVTVPAGSSLRLVVKAK